MKKLALRSNQRGFAALLVAMVIVTVVALLTVGFAQLMRNEVNQATNRHLSQQAYYAAESGINDAIKALSLDPTLSKNTCPPLSAAEASGSPAKQYLTNGALDGTNSAWTCLLIDSSPGSLIYGNVDRISPTTFTVKAVDPTTGDPKPFGTLTFYWQDASSTITGFRANSGTSSNTVFPPRGSAASQWGSTTGMLRASITDLSAGFDRDTLKDNTFTSYLYPARDTVSGPNTAAFTTAEAEQGKIIDGKCNVNNISKTPTPDPRYCSVTYTGINASELLVTMRSIYSDTSVYIAGDTNVHMTGAQSVVDATGRSQNVLKRVQVRIPSQGKFYVPGFVVESVNGVCKQLKLKPGTGSSDSCLYP